MKQQFFIIGCGKMGSAMLTGWLAGKAGARTDFIIIDPYFDLNSKLGQDEAVHCYKTLSDAIASGHLRADVMLLSVKPQMMAEALADCHNLDHDDCLFISIAAGLSLAKLTEMIGAKQTPSLIRTMPNTPAAIGKGMTAIIGNDVASDDDLAMAEQLMGVCGQVVRLDTEAQMDAVTALSGSGPAYVFLLAEAMMQAGITLGLSHDMAERLAEQTIYGAGALLSDADEPAAILRENVTSKGGTTAAALSVLMADNALAELMKKAMKAAADRSVALGKS